MKKAIKAVVLALIIAVMPLSAYASTTFFNNNKLGYHRVGTGSLTDTSFSAELTVTPLPGTSVQPDENYSSEIWVYLYNNSSSMLSAHWSSGHLNCLSAGSVSSATAFSTNVFKFENTSLGRYYLYR